jgi:hypothetical protein
LISSSSQADDPTNHFSFDRKRYRGSLNPIATRIA